MPTDVTLTLYTIEELSPTAKEVARAWYRELWDDHDSEEVTLAIREHVSIEHGLESESYQPGTREAEDQEKQSLKIYWSLASCQGDGVAFSGTFDLAKLAAKHADVRQLLRKLKRLGAEVSVKVTHAGHYYHCNSMTVEVFAESEQRDGERDDRWRKREARIEDLQGGLQDLLQERFKDFSRSAEAAGYKEIEYRTSDEYIDESLEANEYTFLVNGKRFTPPRAKGEAGA